MSSADRDPSIENEPHLRSASFRPDGSELKAAESVYRSALRQSVDQNVEHSVWDEPGLSVALAGKAPADALTYRAWLEGRIAQIGFTKSWAITGLIALLAGPWAILGALMSGGQSAVGIITVTVFAPVAEEIMKTAMALWVVEKRPFLFRSPLQLIVCGLFAGFCFAAVENLIYIFVYLPKPVSPGLIAWRWTVCVALHVGCTFVATLGLVRIWRHTILHKTIPQLSMGYPYLIAAMIIHGVYNGLAVFWDLLGFQF